MSRIGKQPITVPAGVEVVIDGRTVTAQGPRGTLSHVVPEPITVQQAQDGTLVVQRPDDERRSKAVHGLSRTVVHNLVLGVSQGYDGQGRRKRKTVYGSTKREVQDKIDWPTRKGDLFTGRFEDLVGGHDNASIGLEADVELVLFVGPQG